MTKFINTAAAAALAVLVSQMLFATIIAGMMA